MKKLSAIIIDDSKSVIETLTLMIKEYFSDIVEIQGAYSSPIEGLKQVIENEPDILFLDVEMPNMTGFDLTNLLPKRLETKIIIITGHEKYAILSFKHSVFDFVLKPISIIELKLAIEKVRLNKIKNEANVLDSVLMVNSHDKVLFLDYKYISRLEAESSYTDIYYEDKKNRATKTFKHFENLLPSHLFFKVNRGSLININFVSEIVKQDGESYIIMRDKTKIKLPKGKQNEIAKSIVDKMNKIIR